LLKSQVKTRVFDLSAAVSQAPDKAYPFGYSAQIFGFKFLHLVYFSVAFFVTCYAAFTAPKQDVEK